MSIDCWYSASTLWELDQKLSTTISSMADSVNMPGRRNVVPMRSFADTMKCGNPSWNRGAPIHEWWCWLLDSEKRDEHLIETLLPNDYGCNSTTRQWGVGYHHEYIGYFHWLYVTGYDLTHLVIWYFWLQRWESVHYKGGLYIFEVWSIHLQCMFHMCLSERDTKGIPNLTWIY